MITARWMLFYEGKLKVLFEDKPDWFGPKVMRFLLDNPAIFLTTIYVVISGLGLLYQYILFASFGINIIDYAKSPDLFLVAFKNPSAMLFGMGIAASLVIYRFVAKYAKQHQNRSIGLILLSFSFLGSFRREILFPLGIFYFIYFYGYVAELEGRLLLNRSDDVVKVVMKTDHQVFTLLPIGSTESFLFGVEYNDELKNARKSIHPYFIKPVIHAIAQSEISRLDYYRNGNYFEVKSYMRVPVPEVEKDAPQVVRPSP